MKFQLPQFIQTESKLVGPFTLKQFIWLAAGASVLGVLFVLTKGNIFFFVFGIPVLILSAGFAFVKIDGVPLMNLFANMLSYTLNPKRYTYRKEEEPVYQNYQDPNQPPPEEPPSNN